MSGTGLTADVLGRAVFAADGERIGQLAELYADLETGAVVFGCVAMIRRGRRRHVLVPVTDAAVGPDSVTVRCGRELVRRAPSVRPGEELSAEVEPELFAYYDIPVTSTAAHRRRLTPCL